LAFSAVSAAAFPCAARNALVSVGVGNLGVTYATIERATSTFDGDTAGEDATE
jgi:hypothetical protein